MLSIGREGERIAVEFLRGKGYRIIGRNEAMAGVGEIDIIARSPAGPLVLVEVKTMRASDGGLQPEDNLTTSKLTKMRRAGEMFSAKHPELIWEGSGIQLDVVTVALPAGQLTYLVKDCLIRHYENVGD